MSLHSVMLSWWGGGGGGTGVRSMKLDVLIQIGELPVCYKRAVRRNVFCMCHYVCGPCANYNATYTRLT